MYHPPISVCRAGFVPDRTDPPLWVVSTQSDPPGRVWNGSCVTHPIGGDRRQSGPARIMPDPPEWLWHESCHRQKTTLMVYWHGVCGETLPPVRVRLDRGALAIRTLSDSCNTIEQSDTKPDNICHW